jgi:hypothetical protein
LLRLRRFHSCGSRERLQVGVSDRQHHEFARISITEFSCAPQRSGPGLLNLFPLNTDCSSDTRVSK